MCRTDRFLILAGGLLLGTSASDGTALVQQMVVEADGQVHQSHSRTTGGDIVTCVFNHVSADNDDKEELHWGDCVTEDGQSYKIVDDPGTAVDDLQPGETVQVELEPADEMDGDVLYRVTKVISRNLLLEEGSVTSEDAGKPEASMSFLHVIMDYSDKKASEYVNEADIMRKFYGNQTFGTISHMIDQTSYGRVAAPSNLAKVVTVKMNKRCYTKCSYTDIATEAEAAVMQQHGIDPKKYQFRFFFVPRRTCGWNGLAYVGCGHLSKMTSRRRPVSCQAWFTINSAFTWAHELGHNLGLSHADGQGWSGTKLGGEGSAAMVGYGDPQASMGSYAGSRNSDRKFSSFTVGSRHSMNWLRDAAGEAGKWKSQMGAFTVQTMSRGLNCCGADFVGVYFACPSCPSKRSGYATGGDIWVSFRGDEGYSSHRLTSKWQNKVYIHFQRKVSNAAVGKGSELWAHLDVGGSYTPRGSGHSIYVCGISGDVATVAIGTSVRDASRQCKGGSTTKVSTKSETTTRGSIKPTTKPTNCRDNFSNCKRYIARCSNYSPSWTNWMAKQCKCTCRI